MCGNRNSQRFTEQRTNDRVREYTITETNENNRNVDHFSYPVNDRIWCIDGICVWFGNDRGMRWQWNWKEKLLCNTNCFRTGQFLYRKMMTSKNWFNSETKIFGIEAGTFSPHGTVQQSWYSRTRFRRWKKKKMVLDAAGESLGNRSTSIWFSSHT